MFFSQFQVNTELDCLVLVCPDCSDGDVEGDIVLTDCDSLHASGCGGAVTRYGKF